MPTKDLTDLSPAGLRFAVQRLIADGKINVAQVRTLAERGEEIEMLRARLDALAGTGTSEARVTSRAMQGVYLGNLRKLVRAGLKAQAAEVQRLAKADGNVAAARLAVRYAKRLDAEKARAKEAAKSARAGR